MKKPVAVLAYHNQSSVSILERAIGYAFFDILAPANRHKVFALATGGDTISS